MKVFLKEGRGQRLVVGLSFDLYIYIDIEKLWGDGWWVHLDYSVSSLVQSLSYLNRECIDCMRHTQDLD